MFIFNQICYSSLDKAKDALISDQPFVNIVLTGSTNIAGVGNANFTGISYSVSNNGSFSQMPLSLDVHFPSCTFGDPEFTDNNLLAFELTHADGAAIAGLMVGLMLLAYGCRKVIDVIQENQN